MSAKTSSRQSKLDKKVKLAVGRSKSPQGGGETLNSKKKGFQTNKNSKNSLDDGIVVTYENNKLYRKKSSGVRDEKLKTKGETAFVQKDHGDRTMHNDRKRKRVFADRNNSEEGMLHKNLRKGSQRGNTEIDDAVVEGKRSWRGKSQKEKGFRGEGKSCEIDSFDDIKKLSQKLKTVKKDPTIALGYRKQTERNDNGGAAESLGKSTKKKSHEQKSLGDGLEEKPKRKKRVIRIDPHDISNKRLDDGILTTVAAKKKEENMEKNEGVNAQFRAIIPSPSILSFVEENFLGRRRMIELSRAGYNTEFSAPLDNIPSSKSSERERIEEPVFRNKLEFFAAANVSSSFPHPDLPEIAFAGRSNVGKSSLLNALTRQWGVVRTSDKPGLTQTINFFKLGTKVCLVDLPGYGFAYAKEEVKEAWEELVKEYVSSRAGLKRVCLLIDTKWGMKPRDYELINLMEKSQTKYQVVLTKTDLVFPIDVARRAMQIEESLKAKKSAVQPVMMVSSKSGAGVRSLRTVLANIARFAKL